MCEVDLIQCRRQPSHKLQFTFFVVVWHGECCFLVRKSAGGDSFVGIRRICILYVDVSWCSLVNHNGMEA